MLQVRENEIALRKCSGGSAQLRTLEGNTARYCGGFEKVCM